MTNKMVKKEIMRLVVVVVTFLLIVALDITAGVVGLKAEDAQSHAKHVRIIFFECKKKSYDAYLYGVSAAGCLIAAHVLTNLLGLFIASSTTTGATSQTSIRKYISGGCLGAAWLIFCPAIVGLWLGAKSNDSSEIECGLTRHNFLYYGGLACFLHAIFSVGYFANNGSITFSSN